MSLRFFTVHSSVGATVFLEVSSFILMKAGLQTCCLRHLLFVSLCHTDISASNRQSTSYEEPVDPNPTQETSEIKHYNQPAEGSDENEADDQKETNQELKHKLDQSEEHEDSKELTVQPQHQQEAVPDQEEAQEEFSDSLEPEDTEHVETFFSTMSHRYEHATQQGHILQDTVLSQSVVSSFAICQSDSIRIKQCKLYLVFVFEALYFFCTLSLQKNISHYCCVTKNKYKTVYKVSSKSISRFHDMCFILLCSLLITWHRKALIRYLGL